MQVVQNKTRVRVPRIHFPELHYISGTQEIALCKKNDYGEKLFFVHLKNVIEMYPEIREIMLHDHKKNIKLINHISVNK